MSAIPESYILNTPDQNKLKAHADFEGLVRDDSDLALRAFSGYIEKSDLRGGVGRAIGTIATLFETGADTFTHFDPPVYTRELAALEETWHVENLATRNRPAAEAAAKTALRRARIRTYIEQRQLGALSNVA